MANAENKWQEPVSSGHSRKIEKAQYCVPKLVQEKLTAELLFSEGNYGTRRPQQPKYFCGKKNGVFSSLFRNCEQESPMGKIIDGSVTNTEN